MPDRRMLLDDGALLGREGAGLAEDGVGNDDLAEVVEKRAPPHVGPGASVQAHPRGDPVGILRDAAAVAGRVGVARVDRLREREDDVLGVLVLVGELLEHDERADAGRSSSGENGLERKSVTPSDWALIFSAGEAAPVSMTTGSRRVAGSWRMNSRTSRPLRSGSWRSRSTRSGGFARTRSMASSAVAASSTW